MNSFIQVTLLLLSMCVAYMSYAQTVSHQDTGTAIGDSGVWAWLAAAIAAMGLPLDPTTVFTIDIGISYTKGDPHAGVGGTAMNTNRLTFDINAHAFDVLNLYYNHAARFEINAELMEYPGSSPEYPVSYINKVGIISDRSVPIFVETDEVQVGDDTYRWEDKIDASLHTGESVYHDGSGLLSVNLTTGHAIKIGRAHNNGILNLNVEVDDIHRNPYSGLLGQIKKYDVFTNNNSPVHDEISVCDINNRHSPFKVTYKIDGSRDHTRWHYQQSPDETTNAIYGDISDYIVPDIGYIPPAQA